MQYVVHRVNTKEKLKNIDPMFGIEVDIRHSNEKLVLGHDQSNNNIPLIDLLNDYKHSLFVANVKESGIENLIVETLLDYGVKNFFLLDTEFPYIIKNYEKYGNYMCTRFSEYEDIETSKNLINKVSWIWIDTFTKLPLNLNNLETVNKFSSCLVSPSRWGRSDEIEQTIKDLKKINYLPTAVMVEEKEIKIWENFL